MTTPKDFANASNARRAARQAGHDLENIEIIQNGGRFTYRVKDAGAVELPEKLSEMGDATVILTDAEGNDFGPARAGEAYNQAVGLADSEGTSVLICDEDRAEVGRVEPAGVIGEPAEAEAAVEVEAEAEEAEPVAEAVAEAEPVVGVEALFPADDEPAAIDQQAEVEVEAEAEPAPEAPEEATHNFIICIGSASFPLSRRDAIAKEIYRKLKCPVEIRDGTTFEVVKVIQGGPKAASKGAAPGAKRQTGPKGAPTQPNKLEALAISAAATEAGTTREALTDLNGGKQQPWTQILKSAATKWGYEYRSERPTGGKSNYWLVKQAA